MSTPTYIQGFEEQMYTTPNKAQDAEEAFRERMYLDQMEGRGETRDGIQPIVTLGQPNEYAPSSVPYPYSMIPGSEGNNGIMVRDHLIAQQVVQVLSDNFADQLCRACQQPIGPKQGYTTIVLEDPTQKVNTAPNANESLYGPLLASEAIPVPLECRWTVVCHTSPECRSRVYQQRSQFMFARVHLHPEIERRESNERLSLQEYVATRHSAKLDVVRVYPECASLVVTAVAADQPLSGKPDEATSVGAEAYINALDPTNIPLTPSTVLSSFTMTMPMRVADALVIRQAAWTKSQMWGLFQSVSIMDVVMNARNLTPIAQIQSLQKTAASIFRSDSNKKDLAAAVFAHRISNVNTQDIGTTTWRLVARVEASARQMEMRWTKFHETYLHPDAMFPAFLTWSQAFANGVLMSNSINEQAIMNSPYFLRGGRTIMIENLKRAWVERDRDVMWKMMDNAIEEFARKLEKDINPSGKAPLKKLKSFRVNSFEEVNHVSPDGQGEIPTFVYRVNAQEVISRPDVQSDEEYYCLPLSADDLKCYRYNFNPKLPQTSMDIPVIYTDRLLHEQDMNTKQMTPVTLDSLMMIYHVNPDTIKVFNKDHIPTPVPTPAAIVAQAMKSQSPQPPVPPQQLALQRQILSQPHPASLNPQPPTFVQPQIIGGENNTLRSRSGRKS